MIIFPKEITRVIVDHNDVIWQQSKLKL